MKTLHRIVGSRRVVAHRQPSRTDGSFLEPLLLDVAKQLQQLLERGRVCTDRRSYVLKRQFDVVDGQEWQRSKQRTTTCVLSSFT